MNGWMDGWLFREGKVKKKKVAGGKQVLESEN